jgi:hypothetical protein
MSAGLWLAESLTTDPTKTVTPIPYAPKAEVNVGAIQQRGADLAFNAAFGKALQEDLEQFVPWCEAGDKLRSKAAKLLAEARAADEAADLAERQDAAREVFAQRYAEANDALEDLIARSKEKKIADKSRTKLQERADKLQQRVDEGQKSLLIGIRESESDEVCDDYQNTITTCTLQRNTVLRELEELDAYITSLGNTEGIPKRRSEVDLLRFLSTDGAAALEKVEAETSDFKRNEIKRARYVEASLNGQETLLRRAGLTRLAEGN